MVTQLFDDKLRHYQGWARGAESIYAFYDRSALQECGFLRRMLQRWADRFPNEHRRRIFSRMRHKGSGSATEDRQFNAALLELFLHEFLQGTGASVLVDPEIGGLTPDFKVTEQLDTGQQIDYVVEATDIEVGRNSELEIPWIERAALDVLNEIESPDFYLHVETSGALGSMPSKRSLKPVRAITQRH